jgi:hypothetical protein
VSQKDATVSEVVAATQAAREAIDGANADLLCRGLSPWGWAERVGKAVDELTRRLMPLACRHLSEFAAEAHARVNDTAAKIEAKREAEYAAAAAKAAATLPNAVQQAFAADLARTDPNKEKQT